MSCSLFCGHVLQHRTAAPSSLKTDLFLVFAVLIAGGANAWAGVLFEFISWSMDAKDKQPIGNKVTQLSGILDVIGHWKAPMGSELNNICICMYVTMTVQIKGVNETGLRLYYERIMPLAFVVDSQVGATQYWFYFQCLYVFVVLLPEWQSNRKAFRNIMQSSITSGN